MSPMFADAGSVLGRALTWWRSELAGLVPSALRSRRGETATGHVLALAGLDLCLVPPPATRRPPELGATGDDEIARALTSGRPAEGAAPVVLRLPYEACLSRTVEIPFRARADAARIIALELERNLPIGSDRLYTGSYVNEADRKPGSETHVLLMTKRAPLDDAIQRVDRLGGRVVKVDCWSAEGLKPLPVDFLAAGASPDANARGLGAAGLAALAAGLAALAILVSSARQEAALASLEAETARLRGALSLAEAEKRRLVGEGMGQEAISALKAARLPRVQLLDELTRLIPDEAWVTDIKVVPGTLEITGFAKEAAALVPLFERSSLVSAVSSVAPVTFDDSVARERFSYRLGLRGEAAVSDGSPAPEVLEAAP